MNGRWKKAKEGRSIWFRYERSKELGVDKSMQYI